MSKLVRDLIVDTTETTVSEAVSMGGHNAVMFEVWLKSLSGTLLAYNSGATPPEGLLVTIEGSNDKLNWKVAHGGGATVDSTTSQTVPQYLSNTDTTVVPYEFVRLKFYLGDSVSSPTTPVLLVDASIRSFTTSS